MTVVELAKNLGISTRTLYRRMKQKGIDIESLRKDGEKELDQEAVITILASLDTVTESARTSDKIVIESECRRNETNAENDVSQDVDVRQEQCDMRHVYDDTGNDALGFNVVAEMRRQFELQIANLQLELAVANQKIEGLEKQLQLVEEAKEAAKQEVESWKEQAEREHQATERAQQLHALDMQRMLPEKAGMFSRLKNLFGGAKK